MTRQEAAIQYLENNVYIWNYGKRLDSLSTRSRRDKIS